jgi:hypothetical protein
MDGRTEVFRVYLARFRLVHKDTPNFEAIALPLTVDFGAWPSHAAGPKLLVAARASEPRRSGTPATTTD